MTILSGICIYLLIGLIISIAAGWASDEMPEWHETWPTMLWWPIFVYIGVRAAMNEDDEE